MKILVGKAPSFFILSVLVHYSP